MTFSNRQEIIELARSGDLTGYGVQAVVLFGSRAKGTHTDESDWDLAFLVDHPNVDRVTSLHDYWPENPFRDYDDVDACVLTSAYLKVHMYDFGQLSHQIALHGEPLLGAWTMNRELLDAMTQSRPNDWDSNLNDCYRNLNHFFNEACDFKNEENYRQMRSIGNGLVMTSQRAAEYLAKGVAVRRYIEPRKSHDIAGLADDMLNQKPRGVDTTLWLEFTERIRALNGHALPNNQAVYHVTAPTEETIKRACLRTGRTLTLFADEIASALTTPEDPAVMGLSPKSLGDKDYRERLKFHAMGQQADLRRLGMVGREVFSMPNREKGLRDPDRDVGGVMTLPRHLELIKRVFDIYSLENDRERKGYEETGR